MTACLDVTRREHDRAIRMGTDAEDAAKAIGVGVESGFQAGGCEEAVSVKLLASHNWACAGWWRQFWIQRMRRCFLIGTVVIFAATSVVRGSAQPIDKGAPGQSAVVPGPQPNSPRPGQPGDASHPLTRPSRPSHPRPQPRPLPQAYRRHLPRHRYRLGAYSRPGGYYFRQWNVGMVLPGFFRAQNYWLTAPRAYGLRTAPIGAQWVRVDDDAVLVSNSSGQVIDIVYGVFY
jgi:hypothetical protein